jgi:hypothetical protein
VRLTSSTGLRLALVRLVVAGALAAVVLGAWRSWPHLSSERSHLVGSEAVRAAAVHEGLPVELFDRWRAELGEGDRWWLDVPSGPAVGLTTRGAVYRTYALYWFLPALPAPSERDATDVFRLRSLP